TEYFALVVRHGARSHRDDLRRGNLRANHDGLTRFALRAERRWPEHHACESSTCYRPNANGDSPHSRTSLGTSPRSGRFVLPMVSGGTRPRVESCTACEESAPTAAPGIESRASESLGTVSPGAAAPEVSGGVYT